MTDAFAGALGRWFAGEAHLPHPRPVGTDAVTYRRQMNMTLALAASKRIELDEDPFRGWLDATEARAEARGAAARAEAIRLARGWLP